VVTRLTAPARVDLVGVDALPVDALLAPAAIGDEDSGR
jgi:hypothetical protein